MKIKEGTSLEIFVGGDKIILSKYQPDGYTAADFKAAVIEICKEIGKDPLDYLQK